MRQSHARPNALGRCILQAALSQVSVAVLAAGLTVGAFAPQADAAGEFSEVSLIIETNATACDVGLQIFFDADAWRKVTVEKPNGTPILEVAAKGSLFGFGLTEQFNETDEPVMEELVEAFPELECDEPEFSLDEFFFLFPKGTYEFKGVTIEGKALEGEAKLSHVIPAPAEILGPPDDVRQDPNNTIIKWKKVSKPILPGFGPVTIVGFQVIVEREEVAGVPAPLLVFSADLAANDTQIKVPPVFLQRNALYKFEVLQIDVTGNQTIEEGEFVTQR